MPRYTKIIASVIAASISLCFSTTLKMIRTDGLGGKGQTIMPSDGYTSVLFWFHGLGDTCDGWASQMRQFNLDKTKIILPTARNRPISINGGGEMPGWSDIHGLGEDDVEDRIGFEESRERIQQLYNQEIEKGIPSSKICIAGFSQGGALALHFALRNPQPLSCVVALSTWLPLRDEYVYNS